MNDKVKILKHSIEQRIVGKGDLIDNVITTLLAGGHLLIEDVPGVGKTSLAKALADHGVPFELHVYPKGPHGIGLGSEWGPAGAWGNALCRYLLEAGFGK